MSTQNIKTGFAVSATLLSFFAGSTALFVGIAWAEFSITDARNAEACRTAWDSYYQPQYVASQCSIMQRGYRVPTPEWVDLSEIRSPDAGD